MMEKFKEWCLANRISPEEAILSPTWVDNWRQHIFMTLSQPSNFNHINQSRLQEWPGPSMYNLNAGFRKSEN